jgi:DNA repair photolyase
MKKVIFQTINRKALNGQTKIDQHNSPFTLSIGIGCLFECRYCFLQKYFFNRHAEFGEEVKVKLWIANKLDKELEQKKDLPQYLKRVQVNVTTEGYLPQIISETKKIHGRDIMAEVLAVFKKHWDAGNRWMVHLITKSHLVRSHIDIIAKMKDQVQLELTITTLDENKVRLLETFAPSAKKRLNIISDFAEKGVFVRVMCMPAFGDEKEVNEIKKVCIDQGAKAFKHKGVNYWDESALLKGKLISKGGREDTIFPGVIFKSGEAVLVDGKIQSEEFRMPYSNWKAYKNVKRDFENYGYSEMNDYDWGYCK